MKIRPACRHLAIAVLVGGCLLRLVGLTRGISDYVLPEQAPTGQRLAYYQFHPDETTLVEAARQLRNPWAPPQTAYGMLPVYLARMALAVADAWPSTRAGIVSATGPVEDYLAVRAVSALVSTLGLWLLWLIGRRLIGEPAGLLAMLLVAAAPIDLQQAHFFTVDALFNTVMLLAILALMAAVRTQGYRAYLLAGAAIGALAAIRLNGLLLWLLLLAAHTTAKGWHGPGQILARGREPRVWASLLASFGVLLLLQPYLVTEPLRVFDSGAIGDFGGALNVAQGKVLVAWTLADLHTIPYLHHWTHLWPQGVGWPLTLAFLPGVWWALHRREPLLIALVGWCGVYFLLVGGLHAKHVRYLLPLLPLLSLFTAGLGAAVWERYRRLGRLAVVGVALPSLLYGLAFTRVYRTEDSRIQAGRWMAEHLPAGSRIGVESGGFSMQSLVSTRRHVRQTMDVTAPFQARRFLTCGPVAAHLLDQVKDLDYLALVDVNRYRQFTAAPEVSPAIAGFYSQLWAGELGFELVQRFKVYPALGGLELHDDAAEISFLGFDHPAVYLFRRRSAVEAREAEAAWRSALVADPRCPDAGLTRVGAHWSTGEWPDALADLRTVLAGCPDLAVGQYLLADLHQKLGQQDQLQAPRARYVEAYKETPTGYLVPWAAATTLAAAGMGQLALEVLEQGAQLSRRLDPEGLPQQVSSYLSAGRALYQAGYRLEARRALQLAAAMDSTSGRYGQVGIMLLDLGETEAAVEALQQALHLDPENTGARVNLGWAHYCRGDLNAAVTEYQQVLRTAPISVARFNLGLAYLAQGKVSLAEEAYARAVAEFGPAEGIRTGAVKDLRQLLERGVAVEAGRRILAAHWPAESPSPAPLGNF